MVSALTREYYLHYAGHKDDYDIEPIYDRHGDLFTAEAVGRLHERAAAGEAGEETRRLRILVDFAVEGYVGLATKTVEAEVARQEAGLEVEVDGERVGFRESIVTQANEPDPERRRRIEAQHACARTLGWESYRQMCEQCKGLDLGALGEQTAAFLAETESEQSVESEARCLGGGRACSRASSLHPAALRRRAGLRAGAARRR